MLTPFSGVLYLSIVSMWAFQMSNSWALSSDSMSIYDVLSSHGLPVGLLPKGVKNYTLDDSGRFDAYLDQACNAKFESELYYDRKLSGWLSYGQIGNLSGISAQELFLWFPVMGIRVDVPSSGLIHFDVGVVHKQFSLSMFETPPNCTASDHPPNFEDVGLIRKSDGYLPYRSDEGDCARTETLCSS
ncbi:hypothetical protein Nepgr_032823 [Nepenthes gracilis]|uniref:Uncharacterized protein n=1 Tax=Nepenthes gracilis TaxID=150966 RepID=A0AAD3TJD4_NEPGR|nr:hypothetical protein Nepgr_032823 [Nepenthes gracilis]